MKKIFFVCFAVLLLSFFSVLSVQAEEPIKFGFLHSLSGGVGQVYGIPDQAGAKIAVDEINKQEGFWAGPLR